MSYATKAEFLIYIQSYATGTTSAELTKIANDDTQITDLLTTASDLIDQKTNRSFTVSTGTYYYSVPAGQILFFDRDYLAVTSVTNGDGSAISASDYNLLPLNDSPKYAIRLKDGANIVWQGDSNGNSVGAITVTGVTGWNTTVPSQIKQACLVTAVTWYRQRNGEAPLEGGIVTPDGSRIMPAGLPKTALQLLSSWTRSEFSGV